MNTPLRTTLRRLVFGALVITVALIVLLVASVVLSATGLTRDPHGYGIFAGVLFAAVLTPVALILALAHRSLRHRDKPPSDL
ncbi:hypothetical protein [Actinokineospora globicatena]|uniref:hypothetical protein n=1 Tax=Actinokineospora globicatena TaxID=103729 RepID=UPI0020A3869D|nr:hypothetical protein [Actinokineospora globicatena]MCP2303110.1 putative Holin-X, holin superfamily III [Actinokineospora globicatena]GLW79776.1 hypothetical protein Aglo01_42570 [Actinokineospora globicatena]GLW85814.1 hypothetical protein Aglo02_34540 [Actinokineospora globicatena]